MSPSAPDDDRPENSEKPPPTASAADPERGVSGPASSSDFCSGNANGNGRWARLRRLRRLLGKAAALGRVEIRGIAPVPEKERTVERTVNVFTLWWSMNANILAITFGMLAPSFGLGLRDGALVILFFSLLTTLLPAYLCTLGPKTGMRQMVQARYSFGRYIVSVPVLLNLATLTGFCVIMAVIGGQCLQAAVADDNGRDLSVSVGIVVMALLALAISFCGFGVLHAFERYAWIPALVAVAVVVGTGAADLRRQTAGPSPSPAAVLSYGMIVASYMIPWACLSSDFTTYLKPDTSSVRVFLYAYLGLILPTVLLMTLGAAIGGAAPSNPRWQAAYEAAQVGGVLGAVLVPALGGFGRFLLALLALSLLGNLAATSYSVTLNLQQLVLAAVPPRLLGAAALPRCVFSVVFAAGIVIPVAVRVSGSGGGEFFVNLENFVALIGYWSAAFLGVVLVEHFWFRKADCREYDAEAWDDARSLPWGVAALASAALSFALVVPSMAQAWWTGPIAKTTGDIGFELAFVVSALLYLPLRHLEKQFAGR